MGRPPKPKLIREPPTEPPEYTIEFKKGLISQAIIDCENEVASFSFDNSSLLASVSLKNGAIVCLDFGKEGLEKGKKYVTVFAYRPRFSFRVAFIPAKNAHLINLDIL